MDYSARRTLHGEAWRQHAANIAKHGIDFEDAIGIFDGPVLEKADGRRDYGEARITAFGVVDDGAMAVLFTRRGERRRILGEEST